MRSLQDLKWQRRGFWKIIGQAMRGPHGQARWVCICARCGTFKVVDHSSLVSGASQSCGCVRNELSGTRLRTHGMTGTGAWRSWRCMMQRCYNQNHCAYTRYGGAGVHICDEWQTFEGFYRSMGDRPAGCTLDRVDPDRSYTPENTRWADLHTQNNHLRTCRMITHDGQTLSVADWARGLGIRYPRAYRLLIQRGLSIETVAAFLESGGKHS
jgi:hypothetical protein